MHSLVRRSFSTPLVVRIRSWLRPLRGDRVLADRQAGVDVDAGGTSRQTGIGDAGVVAAVGDQEAGLDEGAVYMFWTMFVLS